MKRLTRNLLSSSILAEFGGKRGQDSANSRWYTNFKSLYGNINWWKVYVVCLERFFSFSRSILSMSISTFKRPYLILHVSVSYHNCDFFSICLSVWISLFWFLLSNSFLFHEKYESWSFLFDSFLILIYIIPSLIHWKFDSLPIIFHLPYNSFCIRFSYNWYFFLKFFSIFYFNFYSFHHLYWFIST